MEAAALIRQSKLVQYVTRKAFRQELLTCAIGMLSGRILITGSVSPFGVAYLAAVTMADLNVYYAFTGVIIGSLLLQATVQLQAAATCTLYFLAHLIWARFRKNAEVSERYYLLFVAQAVLLPIFYSEGWDALVSGLIVVGASMFGTLVMQNALRTIRHLRIRHVLSDVEQISISAFFGILLLGTIDVYALGVSLPVILLLLFAMVAALARGIAGVAVSVAIGAMLTIGNEFPLSFVGSLAACTLAGAVMRRMNAMGVFGGFIACCLLVGTYVFSAPHTINLLNLAIAGLVFLVIPQDVMLQLCAYLDAEKNRERFARRTVKRIRDRTSEDMLRTVRICREISKLFQIPEDADSAAPDELKQWAAQAAAGVCAGCPMSVLCWRDYALAANAVMQMLQGQERGERLRIRRPFDPACKHMPQMASAAWHAQNQYLVQQSIRHQTRLQYAFISQQLLGVCDVFEKLANRIEQDRWVDEELETLLLKGLERRGIEASGVDASYPDGSLVLQLRLHAEAGVDQASLVQAVSELLRRPIRVIDTYTLNRQSILIMEEARAIRTEFGAAGKAIAGSGISGDSLGERRLMHGRVLYALSDGMGAGETAKGESEAAIRMLFDLYQIGIARDAALQSVNKLLLARKADMYATLDALYIDLASGYSEFIKYGAPPSFVLRGAKLHVVESEALPAGIVPDAVPSIAKARLKKDDTVFMFSDGVLDLLGESTNTVILDAMKKAEHAAGIAEDVLQSALALGQQDDMSVAVIKIA